MFVRTNLAPGETLYIQGGNYWFFRGYAPELPFKSYSGNKAELPKDKPFWYVGNHESFEYTSCTQIRFTTPAWNLGYVHPHPKFDTGRFADRLRPSGVSSIDSTLLRLAANKDICFARILIEAERIKDRRQMGDLMIYCSEYLRLQAKGLPAAWRNPYIWDFAERAVAVNPYNKYAYTYAANAAMLIGKQELAVRRAKQAIDAGEIVTPVGILTGLSARSKGQLIDDPELLAYIDKAIESARTNGKITEADRKLLKERREAVLERMKAEARAGGPR